jgi:hypothetical protein
MAIGTLKHGSPAGDCQKSGLTTQLFGSPENMLTTSNRQLLFVLLFGNAMTYSITLRNTGIPDCVGAKADVRGTTRVAVGESAHY